MSDNKIFDFCLERLQKDDWLGLSNLYFDNAYVINVFSTRGYVAYSPSKMCFFTMGSLDSTDSELVEGTYAVLEHGILGLQQNITAVSQLFAVSTASRIRARSVTSFALL